MAGASPDLRAMSAEQRLTLRRRLFAFVVASVGAAAAAAISFAMTVYDAANPKPVPIAAPGQPIDTGRWTITFLDARPLDPADRHQAVYAQEAGDGRVRPRQPLGLDQ